LIHQFDLTNNIHVAAVLPGQGFIARPMTIARSWRNSCGAEVTDSTTPRTLKLSRRPQQRVAIARSLSTILFE